MSLNAANCPRCGRLFMKNIKDVCPSCIKEIEKQYERCLKYLRENRDCTIQELSDETEVPSRQIVKFIREGRISIVNAPNMSYPCESCGTLIRENTICDNCRSRLSKDYRNLSEDEKRREVLKQQEKENISYNIRDRLKDRLK